jgi:hypothetical protein
MDIGLIVADVTGRRQKEKSRERIGQATTRGGGRRAAVVFGKC